MIVPNLDGAALLAGCLPSIPRDESIELIVVDNGSRDRSRDEAARWGARVVSNEVNMGFAVACNQGARAASGEYLFFLNNDARLEPGALDELRRVAADQPGTAVWQPLIMQPDGAIDSAGDLFTWSCFMLHDTRPGGRTGDRPIFAAKGAGILVRAEAFQRLGGFLESYFAYFEETDLCWRARLAGWDVRLVPSARIVHLGGRTTSALLDPHQVRYLSFRNRIRSILANPSWPSAIRIMPVHLLGCLASAFIFAITGRGRSAVAVLSALSWPPLHPGEMRAQRQRAQGDRQVGDAEVFRPEIVERLTPSRLLKLIQGQMWRWERNQFPDGRRRNRPTR